VDLLAVTIGNVHGKYALPPTLDLLRLASIRRQLNAVSSGRNQRAPYLVLHGASGLEKAHIQSCLRQHIVKFNVNTDLREAALHCYQQALLGSNKMDILQLMKESTEAMSKIAEDKINLFRSFHDGSNKQ
jgi:fructose-bisphosphate aldolase class II